MMSYFCRWTVRNYYINDCLSRYIFYAFIIYRMNYTNFQYFLGDAEPCDNQRDLEKKIDVESTSEYEEFEQPDLFGENNMEE